MDTIKVISQENFFRKFPHTFSKEFIDALFSDNDVRQLQKLDSELSMQGRGGKLISYVKFSIQNPRFFSSFLLPQILSRLSNRNNQSFTSLKTNLISNNLLKAKVVSAFKPKRILEIGTYLGVGAAVFKIAAPKAQIYTMNPRENRNANNPIESKYIGHFYKRKKIKISQIYADSTKYDYRKIAAVDISFIDGNHAYEYVLSDLQNVTPITKKCIIIDDYIPKNQGNKGKLIYGPWTDGVVRATDKFLISNSKKFKYKYWLKDTKLCVLIK